MEKNLREKFLKIRHPISAIELSIKSNLNMNYKNILAHTKSQYKC